MALCRVCSSDRSPSADRQPSAGKSQRGEKPVARIQGQWSARMPSDLHGPSNRTRVALETQGHQLRGSLGSELVLTGSLEPLSRGCSELKHCVGSTPPLKRLSISSSTSARQGRSRVDLITIWNSACHTKRKINFEAFNLTAQRYEL